MLSFELSLLGCIPDRAWPVLLASSARATASLVTRYFIIFPFVSCPAELPNVNTGQYGQSHGIHQRPSCNSSELCLPQKFDVSLGLEHDDSRHGQNQRYRCVTVNSLTLHSFGQFCDTCIDSGKGEMKTYFLLGMKGSPMQLTAPDASEMNPASKTAGTPPLMQYGGGSGVYSPLPFQSSCYSPISPGIYSVQVASL
jgi:hypothetical protein